MVRVAAVPVLHHELEGLAVQVGGQVEAKAHIQDVARQIHLRLVHGEGPHMLLGEHPVFPHLGVPEHLLPLAPHQGRPCSVT
jgi:hypothetical protein